MSAEDHNIDKKTNGDMGTLAEHLSIGDPQMVAYVGENAAQPQQLEYDILVNLGKRDREAQEDLPSEDKNGSPSSSSEESPAKRSKMQAESSLEKKANTENWETMYQKLVAFKVSHLSLALSS
jgi:hypothetical protein